MSKELMKVTIAESFTKDELAKMRMAKVRPCTPQSFSAMRWDGVEASGLEYYVDKAVEAGAEAGKKVKAPKADAKKKDEDI